MLPLTVSFELSDDQAPIERTVEAVVQAHSTEEPVIRLQSIRSSRSKGQHDKHNPNRWWTTTGDWRQREPES